MRAATPRSVFRLLRLAGHLSDPKNCIPHFEELRDSDPETILSRSGEGMFGAVYSFLSIERKSQIVLFSLTG
jgi:hypothetical protein